MLQRQQTRQNMNKSFTKGENKGYLAVWTFSRLLGTFYEQTGCGIHWDDED